MKHLFDAKSVVVDIVFKTDMLLVIASVYFNQLLNRTIEHYLLYLYATLLYKFIYLMFRLFTYLYAVNYH